MTCDGSGILPLVGADPISQRCPGCPRCRKCETCGGNGDVYWRYDDPDLEASVDARDACPDCGGTGVAKGNRDGR